MRRELWRVDPQYLEQAQDDASLLAIRDQERAGLDIITDGEARRESYSNRFATALSGVDVDNPGTALDRSGKPNQVPRVVGPIERKHPVQVRDVEFLRANTSKPIKITVPGPFTMSQQAQNDAYESDAELALAYAAAVHDEIVDLFAAGADIVQIDEPYMQARPERAREFGLAALERALDGVVGTTAVHLCFGYAAIIHERPSAYSFLPELAACSCDQISIETAQSGLDTSILATLPGKRIILGVIDLDDHAVESPETVAARIRRALPTSARRARRGTGLRHEVPAARLRLRQARVARRRCRDRPRRVDPLQPDGAPAPVDQLVVRDDPAGRDRGGQPAAGDRSRAPRVSLGVRPGLVGLGLEAVEQAVRRSGTRSTRSHRPSRTGGIVSGPGSTASAKPAAMHERPGDEDADPVGVAEAGLGPDALAPAVGRHGHGATRPERR